MNFTEVKTKTTWKNKCKIKQYLNRSLRLSVINDIIGDKQTFKPETICRAGEL